MKHVVDHYSIELQDGNNGEDIMHYTAVYDGLVVTPEDIDKLVDRIRWALEQDRKVIVAIFESEY